MRGLLNQKEPISESWSLWTRGFNTHKRDSYENSILPIWLRDLEGFKWQGFGRESLSFVRKKELFSGGRGRWMQPYFPLSHPICASTLHIVGRMSVLEMYTKPDITHFSICMVYKFTFIDVLICISFPWKHCYLSLSQHNPVLTQK